MSRLIFVPQYPTPMRYQSWWLSEFSKDHKMTYASGDYKCLAEEICKAALYTIQTEEEN
jgi:hypothetical protein